MRKVATGLIAMGLAVPFAASCGESGRPDVPTVTVSPTPSNAASVDPSARCRAYGPWNRLNLNFFDAKERAVMARALGTTAEAVKDGLGGEMHCTPGYTLEQVQAVQLVEVGGIPPESHVGSTCLLTSVYVRNDSSEELRPAPNQVYEWLGAVCPLVTPGTPGPSGSSPALRPLGVTRLA